MKISKLELKRHNEYIEFTANHYDDMAKISQLKRQIHKLIHKYGRMKKTFIKKSPKFCKRMEMTSYLREQIRKNLRSKRNITSANRKELMQLQKGLRVTEFYDRVRFIDISQMYGSKINDPWKYANMEEVRKLSNRSMALKRSLKRLNDETLVAIKDMHEIESAIPFFHQKHISKRKMEQMPWWPTVQKYKSPVISMSAYLNI